MKKSVLRQAGLALLTLALLACSDNKTPEATARQLLDASGMRHGILTTSAASASAAPAKDRAERDANKLLKETFQPETLNAAMVSYLVQHLTTHDMEAALQWLQSPLGKQIVALDQTAISPTDTQNATLLAELEKDTGRIKLLEKLYDAMYVTSGALDILVDFRRQLFVQQVGQAPGNSGLPQPESMPALEEQAQQQRMEHKVEVITDMLFSYRELSDDDIRAFTAFADSPSGRNYYRALHGSMATAMMDALKPAEKP